MKAFDLINPNSQQLIYLSKSKINGAGKGAFAKKFIKKGFPVVIYFGNKIFDVDIYDLYINNPNDYYQLNKCIRGTPNGYVIRGDKAQHNLNLAGVYVNDVSSISCDKNDININVLKEYAQTLKKCNLDTIDTKDFPVYVSSKRIKKGEELYAHYGIGYWLSHIGFSPEEISDLNTKYNFASLY